MIFCIFVINKSVMSWYIRKSVKVGLVRFNLSKSGIGASVGIKGFRIGIKPNGKSYVHAGRGGLYYREEFGNNNQALVTQSVGDTEFYNTAKSRDVKSDYKSDVVNELNKSYNAFRFDYLTGLISILIIVAYYNKFCYVVSDIVFKSILSVLILLGIILVVCVARWETKRRRIDLIYEFDGEDSEYYEKIISAFNQIAICDKIWGINSSQYIPETHIRKVNAGAANLVDRTRASIGTGKLPWVNTNITIPLLKASGRSLYFMPDGILVYDALGVAYVNYIDIEIYASTTSFIEDWPTKDANIIYYTWQYANVSGGPDRRFKNNRKIPVCRYGELTINVKGKQLLYIITSKEQAPKDFEKAMKDFNKFIAKKDK